MKLNITITKTMLLLIGITFTLSSCSSWHYKHPRVRIDEENSIHATKELPAKDMVAIEQIETLQVETLESKISHDPRIKNDRSDNRYHKNINDKKSTANITENHVKPTILSKLFAEPIKKIQDKLAHAKSVEKTALNGWVRIMILLLVLGVIFLVVGLILTAFFSGGFWWIFYTLGALLILAGLIVMILGLLSII